MTITVGSVWKRKRSKMRCTVRATLKYHGVKFIIYEPTPIGPEPYLAIKSSADFLRNWEHPDPIGDVP
jgi:hypothetical protein